MSSESDESELQLPRTPVKGETTAVAGTGPGLCSPVDFATSQSCRMRFILERRGGGVSETDGRTEERRGDGLLGVGDAAKMAGVGDGADGDVDAGALEGVCELGGVVEGVGDVAAAVDEEDGAADLGEGVAGVGFAVDEEADGDLVVGVEVVVVPVFLGLWDGGLDEAEEMSGKARGGRAKGNSRVNDAGGGVVEAELEGAVDGVCDGVLVDGVRVVEALGPAVVDLLAALCDILGLGEGVSGAQRTRVGGRADVPLRGGEGRAW